MFRTGVLVFCFFFAVLTPYSVSAMTVEQKAKIHEHFESIGIECMKDVPITEDDINDLRNKKVPAGENAACFMACMLKKIGVIDDKGMLQKENALELAKKVFEDPEEVKNIEDFLHSCAHVNTQSVSDGEKGCERAVMASQCMSENLSKFGFDM